jgi:hypothetical protein
MRLILLLVFMIATHVQLAEARDIKAQAGQPFCQKAEDLPPYLIAIDAKNFDEAHRLDCGGLAAGTRLTILDELPSDSAIGHIAHIRAFMLGGGGSIVGYTVILKP